jgi:hypothetical protein
MKTIDLEKEQLDLKTLIELASHEPVLLVTAQGKEFCLAQADNFEQEVESLRRSQAFQRFLDERSKSNKRISLDELEAEIDQELAAQNKTA